MESPQSWRAWIESNPQGYCRARASVSLEDSISARQKFSQGKITAGDLLAVLRRHEKLLVKLSERFGFNTEPYRLND